MVWFLTHEISNPGISHGYVSEGRKIQARVSDMFCFFLLLFGSWNYINIYLISRVVGLWMTPIN
ncbi:hypothetical protein I3843_15G155400 [Carya illinoinensis]|nr:hypothetical protein I3843_15G155400 [Carya illinoinensis]